VLDVGLHILNVNEDIIKENHNKLPRVGLENTVH
jgi:hypothetical protein